MRFGSCGVAVVAAGAVAMAGLARAGVEISEVMADNGKSVVTAGGVAGLDWVELRNTGSEAVDLSGWLVTDDPAKDASLWRAIGGAATIPAGGTLVVFADSSFTDWNAADAHVAIGFSSNGEDVVLANPEGTIVDQFSFGDQLKDVSFGRVNASETVLERSAAVQYRVGEGEWKNAAGWVGMAGETPASFTVTATEFRNPVNSVSDVEELSLEPTKIKQSVTGQYGVICFGSNYAPENGWGWPINLPTDYGGSEDGSNENPSRFFSLLGIWWKISESPPVVRLIYRDPASGLLRAARSVTASVLNFPDWATYMYSTRIREVPSISPSM